MQFRTINEFRNPDHIDWWSEYSTDGGANWIKMGGGSENPAEVSDRSPSRVRNAPGLMPVMTRKDRVKWLWSAKPRSQLMSANERRDRASARTLRARAADARTLRCPCL